MVMPPGVRLKHDTLPKSIRFYERDERLVLRAEQRQSSSRRVPHPKTSIHSGEIRMGDHKSVIQSGGVCPPYVHLRPLPFDVRRLINEALL